MHCLIRTIPVLSVIAALTHFVATGASAQQSGCLACHQGIERFSDGPMMETIESTGADVGDPAGCVVCHGGNLRATDKEAAHTGSPRDLRNAGGPLPQEMREKMERTGLCMGCHQNMADPAFWAKVNSPGWVTNEQHRDVMNRAVQALSKQ